MTILWLLGLSTSMAVVRDTPLLAWLTLSFCGHEGASCPDPPRGLHTQLGSHSSFFPPPLSLFLCQEAGVRGPPRDHRLLRAPWVCPVPGWYTELGLEGRLRGGAGLEESGDVKRVGGEEGAPWTVGEAQAEA